MKVDRVYLKKMATMLRGQGFEVKAQLELGDPAAGNLKISD